MPMNKASNKKTSKEMNDNELTNCLEEISQDIFHIQDDISNFLIVERVRNTTNPAVKNRYKVKNMKTDLAEYGAEKAKFYPYEDTSNTDNVGVDVWKIGNTKLTDKMQLKNTKTGEVIATSIEQSSLIRHQGFDYYLVFEVDKDKLY